MRIEKSYSLLPHNTFGIDVRCRRFIEYDSVDDLRKVVALLSETPDERVLHIGSGSNLLFTKDFDGTVLHSNIRGIVIKNENDGSLLVCAGAGEDWDAFVAYCVNHSCYGLENLSHIPGEVGASAVQNIGAYGSEVCDFITEVETIELATGQLRIFSKEECRYAYRHSIFKTELRGQYVVTHVTYRLSSTFTPNLSYAALTRELDSRQIKRETLTAEQLRQVVIDVRRSKLHGPSELGSAGSFFVNPVITEEKFHALQSEYPLMPHYVVEGGVKVPAGWLIEQCGWKGRRLGSAGVYDKQALVLVNYGGATGEDIVRLSKSVQEAVAEKFGIEIHPEVNFI